MPATVRLAGSARPFPHAAALEGGDTTALPASQLDSAVRLTAHVRLSPGGAAATDVGAVVRWASQQGLDVGGIDRATGRIALSAPLRRCAAAFGVTLEQRRTVDAGGRVLTYRDHRQELWLPASLDGIVTGVFGLCDRPLARTHLAMAPPDHPLDLGYTPEQLAGIYDFPVLDAGGAGRRLVVGIAELGGAVDPADVAALSASCPRVHIIEESVDGGRATSDRSGPDTEVALDWQVIARILTACAPAADVDIVIKYAPNTDRGFTDVTASFASDGRPYAAVSTSWGSPEDYWTPNAMDAMDRAYALCAQRGIVHCVAAGDNGARDGIADGRLRADHPASSPHALACGGTRLIAVGDIRLAETAWNELDVNEGSTGGGVSGHFAPPSYQVVHGIVPLSRDDRRPGRGVPDVAAVADPTTGYIVRRDGADVIVGGTSAVAPLWAALLTLAAPSSSAPALDVHERLYSHPGAFHDIVAGDNAGYRARQGWDPVTGLGTPRGRAVAGAVAGRAPQVPSPRPQLAGRELS
ncbi:MAG: S53 family peptidase [Candidatus Dormibacteria bacterium]